MADRPSSTMYQDAAGAPIPADELVWGMAEAAALCGVARMTVWRWVKRGYFVDGVELWNDFRPGELRTTTVFHRPALLRVAGLMAQHCEQTGAGWRPERWGRRKRERIAARTGRRGPRGASASSILTPEAEAELYGFPIPTPTRAPEPQDAPDGLAWLLSPGAYETLYGRPEATADTAAAPERPRPGRPVKPRVRYEPTGRGRTPLRIDRRTVNGADVRRCWPAYRAAFAAWKAEHEGRNPSVRQWAAVVGLEPGEALALIDRKRDEYRDYVPTPPVRFDEKSAA